MCVPPTGFGSVTAVINSPGASVVSMCGVSPGRRWKSAIGMLRVWPSGRTVSTVASSARMATAMSLGVRRDAGLARADNRVLAIDAADGRAAAAGLPFVAGLVGVVEIGTAGPLQQIAGGRRLVAQLAGSTGQQRPRQQSIIPTHPLVGGEIGVAHQCADPQSAFRRRLDLVERKPVHVDQVLRGLDLQASSDRADWCRLR